MNRMDGSVAPSEWHKQVFTEGITELTIGGVDGIVNGLLTAVTHPVQSRQECRVYG